jgi:hypothetical protein
LNTRLSGGFGFQYNPLPFSPQRNREEKILNSMYKRAALGGKNFLTGLSRFRVVDHGKISSSVSQIF